MHAGVHQNLFRSKARHRSGCKTVMPFCFAFRLGLVNLVFDLCPFMWPKSHWKFEIVDLLQLVEFWIVEGLTQSYVGVARYSQKVTNILNEQHPGLTSHKRIQNKLISLAQSVWLWILYRWELRWSILLILFTSLEFKVGNHVLFAHGPKSFAHLHI
jgi:hypothetical protein